MGGVKFYSEYDMACGGEILKIIEKIKNNDIEKEWSLLDVIEGYNIIKYLRIPKFKEYLVQETSCDITTYENQINKNIGMFLEKNKGCFFQLYRNIDYSYKPDLFEIVEEYKLYLSYKDEEIKCFMYNENVQMHMILKHKKTVEQFDIVIKEKLISDVKNAEIILSKFLNEQIFYLPKSLNNKEIEKILGGYINSDEANINVLRKIVNFPSNKGLLINDRIKLYAKRKIKEKEEEIFSTGVAMETSVEISYPIEQDEPVIFTRNGGNVEVNISRKWIQENLDFPTLWNNFIYIFNFCDMKMRVELVSKASEEGVLESIIRQKGNYLYVESTSFQFKEMLSNIEIISYSNILNIYDIRLEEMIEWFFNNYIKEEFQVNNFIVKMPSENATYFEKCRTILPEIDRIFKQYNMLVEDGEIDQELIQISSSSIKTNNVKSYNDKKYVYSSSEWYRIASYFLFSDQSSIFYLPNKDEQYQNFYELLIGEKLQQKDFGEHQLAEMQWLFKNNIIKENEDGIIHFVDDIIIYILKELYYEEVLSLWHYPQVVRDRIDDLYKYNMVYYENSLLTKNEQDYLDYYLNKSKFTNGHDIRNRYLHGTNTNDEKQYERDYYLILKLFVIIIIKVNDDLIIKEDYVEVVDN